MGSEDPIKFLDNGSRAMEMKQNQSLLDLLAESAGCSCLSDLRSIKKPKRQQLADKLERISPEAARKLLIDHYCNQEEIPLPQSSQGGNAYESE